VRGLVNRAAVADLNRNKVPPALTGAKGVSFTSYPALPTAPCNGSPTLPNACFTTTSAANFGANLVTATYEYEVCFKCHSSFAFGNTTYPTAPATGASGQLETDVAAEFSPNNRSGHPVVAPLGNYGGSLAPKSLAPAQLLPPWNVNVGAQTMLCTDCHNTDAASLAAQGPHGSAVPFMLAGANRAWPYTTAGASGTPRTFSTTETNLGTANGLFCRNCHPQQTSSSSNWIHQRNSGQHGSDTTVGACVACHIRVPHGGKVSRLIVTTNAPARYKVGTPNLASFAKAATKDSYTMNNVKSSCAEHSGGAGGEAW
jgi:hypothetical protein